MENSEVLLKVENLCQYFGPTKAEISLVVPIRATIGKKGGRR